MTTNVAFTTENAPTEAIKEILLSVEEESEKRIQPLVEKDIFAKGKVKATAVWLVTDTTSNVTVNLTLIFPPTPQWDAFTLALQQIALGLFNEMISQHSPTR